MINKKIKGVDLLLGVDFLEDKQQFVKSSDLVIYLGCIDEYYDYYFGALDYLLFN